MLMYMNTYTIVLLLYATKWTTSKDLCYSWKIGFYVNMRVYFLLLMNHRPFNYKLSSKCGHLRKIRTSEKSYVYPYELEVILMCYIRILILLWFKLHDYVWLCFRLYIWHDMYDLVCKYMKIMRPMAIMWKIQYVGRYNLWSKNLHFVNLWTYGNIKRV